MTYLTGKLHRMNLLGKLPHSQMYVWECNHCGKQAVNSTSKNGATLTDDKCSGKFREGTYKPDDLEKVPAW